MTEYFEVKKFHAFDSEFGIFDGVLALKLNSALFTAALDHGKELILSVLIFGSEGNDLISSNFVMFA